MISEIYHLDNCWDTSIWFDDRLEVGEDYAKSIDDMLAGSFTDPGKYTVTITTKLSKKYYYNLTVEGGLSVVNLSPTVMECEKNEGFINGAVKSGDTSYGIKSYTTLGIAQKSGFVSTKAKNNGFDAYGVNGDSASIYLRLNYSEQLSNSGWYVVSDPYGKKEKETINGTFAGAVGKGALIVRTSSDGTNWVDVNKDRYSNGLYTTDYATYYAPEEDVLIYTPKGNDVLSGVYIDVLFAYQVKNDDLKETIDCLEEYKFYLCSNELEAVTFHNLSIKDLKPYVGEDKESLEIYKKAETLVNNSGTVKGFKIDTSLKETKNVDDLRSKKIPYSIIVFGDGQKNLLVSKASNDGNLPVISPKKYAYVQPRTDGKIISDRNDFEFINDKYGCDSYKVKVVDRNGKEYSIAYNKGVGQQLEKAKCPSGMVSIVEETVYGQSVTYEAIYIAPSDNTAKLSISYYDDGIEKKKEFSIEDNLTSIDVDAFGLESLEDELDPYSVVYVKSMDEDTFFSADDLVKKAWSEPGTYEIKIVNRLGYSYSINVNVRESEYVVLSFTGDGTEALEDIVVKKDECNIALPPLSRPGYVFEGFCDTEGNVFTDTIDKLPNKSQLELLATWSPKKVNVIVSDIDGKVLSEETANYGSVYIAHAYETKEGYTFNGWFYNGTLLEDNKILISSEEDIHLIPSLVEVASGEEVVMVEKKHHAWPWIIILLFGGAAFVGYRRYTKGKRKDKENDQV